MWQWVGILVVMLIAAVVGFFAMTGEDISTIRETNNAGREAASMLPNVVEAGGVGAGIVNSLVVGGLMMVPMPLFFAGGSYHVLAGIFMMTLVVFTIGLMRDYNLRGRASAGIAILMALFVVQCLFEPDLGSVMRHWTMLGTVLVSAWCVLKEGYERA